MDNKTTFTVKQKIVYPGQGVGEIVDITNKTFKDTTLKYYVIYLDHSDMTILIPVNRAEELGLRTIVSKEVAQKALEFLSEEADPIPNDWKARYQLNLNLFKSGTIFDTASVVRALYRRSKKKELPIQERKLYESAYRILHDEILYALQSTKTEIETLIHTYLELHQTDTNDS